ncbi:NAD(P)H-quinone oxidoreductase [Ignavibacterium sp.]|uniref:NAD(P)H-quinone oxidoreductase n=1 Tax=Ignavibacterium sp. TaxID=2651167 RepID=UPI0021F9EDD0|nr:MAG: NAD(P)H quinone oxidoreductase [Ignavibacterium sp.]
MKAILFDEPCAADKLYIGEFPKPEVGEEEILVEVKATALNRADILQRLGKYPPPTGASPILGLEIAGVVVAKGSKVFKWKTGDKVFGLIPGGGYAQYAVIHEEMAMRIPDKLSFEEAAAIPEAFLTSYQAIVWLAELKANEFILIHAAASGVGTAAIQLAREIGAKIIITASAEKHFICKELGADVLIDYKSQNFKDVVLNATNNYGVDVIIDFIGANYFNDNIDSLTRDGRLILLATLSGGKVNEFDVRQILTKRLKIVGSTLRSRSLDYQIKLTKDFYNFAYDKISSGRIKTIIDKVFDWTDVSEAHKRMEANKNIGKIVLRIN